MVQVGGCFPALHMPDVLFFPVGQTRSPLSQDCLYLAQVNWSQKQTVGHSTGKENLTAHLPCSGPNRSYLQRTPGQR